MISDDVRASVKADSFHPFEIILKTGEVFLVRTSDHAWVRPSGMIHLVDQDERPRIFPPARIHQIKAPAEEHEPASSTFSNFRERVSNSNNQHQKQENKTNVPNYRSVFRF